MMTVDSWWYFLSAMGVINITAWSFSVLALNRRRQTMEAELHAARRLQLVLSAIYVFGCAYRSFFLVYDVPRIVFFDSMFCSVIVGRSVATLAELSFVAQWALLMREHARSSGSIVAKFVAIALVPLIAIAETCSWYSVLTTSNVGHVAEESLWGVCAALLIAGVLAMLPATAPPRRSVLLAWCMAGMAYVTFMFTVDVPMYWSRWVADEAARRPYLSVVRGLLDVAQHRVISHRWVDWRSEVAWMSLYFSVAVWISISLIHAPQAAPRALAAPRRGNATSGAPTLG